MNINPILAIFLIMTIGYMVGKINFFGIKFGASAILIAALVFGHFGLELPPILSSIGLCLFLAPIGLMAGTDFVSNIKKNGVAFLAIAFLTCVIGGICVAISVKFLGIPVDLSLGIASGALTSTAMLGTVNGLTESLSPGVGYGIAYVFGVVGVVLFVQIIPRLLKVNRDEENAKLVLPGSGFNPDKVDMAKFINFDPHGLFAVSLAIVLGAVIGLIKIKVSSAISISLGLGGGSLIAGLFLGHIGHLGPINLTYDKKNLQLVRDLGLAFFLMQAGVKGGAGFVEIVSQYGIKLFLAGVMMTSITTIVSFIISYKLFKLPLFAALGTTTGSMTSAPSLGTLLDVTGDDKVSSLYAACQPVATVLLVFLPQIIVIIFGI